MKLNEFSKLCFTDNFTMSVWLLQCANRGYKFKVKLNLKYPMHLSHLMSKKFSLLKIMKPNRILVTVSYCLTFILKFLVCNWNIFEFFLGFSLSSSWCCHYRFLYCLLRFFILKTFVCLPSEVVLTSFLCMRYSHHKRWNNT